MKSVTSVNHKRIETSSETVTAPPAFHEGSHIMDQPVFPQRIITDTNNVKTAAKMQYIKGNWRLNVLFICPFQWPSSRRRNWKLSYYSRATNSPLKIVMSKLPYYPHFTISSCDISDTIRNLLSSQNTAACSGPAQVD